MNLHGSLKVVVRLAFREVSQSVQNPLVDVSILLYNLNASALEVPQDEGAGVFSYGNQAACASSLR